MGLREATTACGDFCPHFLLSFPSDPSPTPVIAASLFSSLLFSSLLFSSLLFSSLLFSSRLFSSLLFSSLLFSSLLLSSPLLSSPLLSSPLLSSPLLSSPLLFYDCPKPSIGHHPVQRDVLSCVGPCRAVPYRTVPYRPMAYLAELWLLTAPGWLPSTRSVRASPAPGGFAVPAAVA